MKRVPRSLFLSSIATGLALVCASTSQAGPWIDSILGRRPPAYPVGSPLPVSGQAPYAAGYGAYPSWNAGYVPSSYAPSAGSLATGFAAPMVSGYGAYPTYAATGYAPPVATLPMTSGFGSYGSVMPPTTNAPLLPPGIPQSAAGVLPTAAYDTQWGRTPVTYYRPVTAFDPRYGTTVTSLQPCTSYQYQAQRVPTIAPRPILGEYGFQANKWPSLTGPGYNPTGLAATPFPSYQGMPSSGMPMSGVAPTFAPVANSGNAFGMPATSLPATTMPYQPPTYPTTTANYLGSSATSNVWGNASPYASTWAPYNNYGSIVPSAAYSSTMPGTTSGLPTYSMSPSSACANGTCASPSPYGNVPGMTNPGLANPGLASPGSMSSGSVMPNNMINPGASNSGAPYVPTPNIPGATSVTPLGPPSYSNSPSPVLPPNGGFNPGMLPQQLQVMPNPQVLPNQPTPGTGLGDPDATRVPGGSQASTSAPSSIAQELQRLPMVAIDRGSSGTSSGLTVGTAPSIPSTLSDSPSAASKAAEEPSNNWQFSGVQPLTAPQNFDSKPKWNPTLLDPEDRTVMERSGQLMRPRNEKNGKIELRDEDSAVISTIALSGKNEESSRIQLVSGSEPRKIDAKDSTLPGFRPAKSLSRTVE